MSLRCLTLVAICVVFISTEAVSGGDVKKAVERVPKPEITIEKDNNTDVVYLRCGYSETIIWKNSAGDILKGTKNHTLGEFITVKNTRNTENFYTCTLRNAVNEETSDRVSEGKIFGTERVPKPEITIEKSSKR